jgi:hypothetical protein
MRRTVIRYKAKPDMADRNAELVAAVFAELKALKPEGLRYMSLRLEDDTFIHVVETADDGASPLPKLAAFAAFQSGIRERCAEPPVPKGATIVGNYCMLYEN